MRPTTTEYKLVRVLKDTREDSVGIAFEFHRPDSPFLACIDFPLGSKQIKLEPKDSVNLLARQACLIPKHATMTEVGKILTALGEFFQAPEEALLCRDKDTLTGNEFNYSETQATEVQTMREVIKEAYRIFNYLIQDGESECGVVASNDIEKVIKRLKPYAV